MNTPVKNLQLTKSQVWSIRNELSSQKPSDVQLLSSSDRQALYLRKIDLLKQLNNHYKAVIESK